MPSAHYWSAEIPPGLRRQLSCIPPDHLDELISLALEATSHDPSINFIAAVLALWRCNAHNPRSYGTMSDDPRGDESESESTAHDEQHALSNDQRRCQVQHQDQDPTKDQGQPTQYTYDPDTEMPDAPSPTPSPPSSPSTTSSSKPTPTPTSTPQSNKSTYHVHESHPNNRTLILTLLRDRTHPHLSPSTMSWQRREQLALAQAYLQAFDLWPHARSSEKRCEGFLARYVNL